MLLLGGGLLGLDATGLLLSLGLDRLLGAAESGDALDSGLTKVGAVATVGGLEGDGLVGPVVCRVSNVLILPYLTNGLKANSGMLVFGCNSLASGLVATVGDLGGALSGLVGVLLVLADDLDTALLVGDNTDRLSHAESQSHARSESSSS